MENKSITNRDVDFAKWYTDVVRAAKLADYSSVKGCTVMEPNGFAIWEKMQRVLDGMFKKSGHKNVSMPVFIPENLLNLSIYINAIIIVLSSDSVYIIILSKYFFKSIEGMQLELKHIFFWEINLSL